MQWKELISKIQSKELQLLSGKNQMYKHLSAFKNRDEMFENYRRTLLTFSEIFYQKEGFKRIYKALFEHGINQLGVSYGRRKYFAEKADVSESYFDKFVAWAKENIGLIVLPTFGKKNKRKGKGGQAHNVYVFAPMSGLLELPEMNSENRQGNTKVQSEESPITPYVSSSEEAFDGVDKGFEKGPDIFNYPKDNSNTTTSVAITNHSNLHIHNLAKANHFPRELVESLRGFSPQKVYHIVKRVLGALKAIGAEFKVYSNVVLKIVRKAVKMNPNEFKKNITSYICFEIKRQVKAVMKWEENQVKEAEYYTDLEAEELIPFEELQQKMFQTMEKAIERQRMEKIRLWFGEFRKNSSDFSSIEHAIEKVVLEFGVLRNQASLLVHKAIGPISVMPTKEEMDEMPC